MFIKLYCTYCTYLLDSIFKSVLVVMRALLDRKNTLSSRSLNRRYKIWEKVGERK